MLLTRTQTTLCSLNDANLQRSAMSDAHVSRMGDTADTVTSPSSPAIYQTAAFDIPDLDVLHAMIRGGAPGHIYTRDSNPNHAALAESISAMERTEAGAVFSSGMGALSSVFLALASAGDHVVVARALYGRTLQMAQRFAQKYDVAVTLVDVTDFDQIKAAITDKTRFALIETISNPMLEIADVQGIAASLGSIPLVVDSTFTTPELIRPGEHGAAITIHSASKYLNGHGDVMLGVAAGSRLMIKKLNEAVSIFGLNANPFECWLCQRGLRTLPLRMQHICKTTQQLATFLDGHPAVRRTHYPGLSHHPSHDLATRMYPDGTGGIIAFELNGGGQDAVSRFMRSAKNIPFSATLADCRTTISHPVSTSHRYMTSQEQSALGLSDELIRLSIGLEPFELLRDELNEALTAVSP
jgi:cystathionine beta-lyase/cystathionine gamma-synthase